MWNPFKKKEKVSETDKVFKDFGKETNDVKPQGAQDRKATSASAAEKRNAQIKKDQILERLTLLRKELFINPEFDAYSLKLEDMIGKLKRMSEGVNKTATSVVDNFILDAVNEAINYCNRGNYVAMGACMDNIEGFIEDRFQAGSYYTDKEFCELKLQRNSRYVEMQNQQSARSRFEKRLDELKANYHNPNLHISKDSIVREVNRIKEEIRNIDGIINSLESQIKIYDKAITEIKMRTITHSNDDVFDITDKIDNIIETKRENELDAEAFDRFNEKISESHRRVSSSSLIVNDDVSTSDSSEELDDDFFKV